MNKLNKILIIGAIATLGILVLSFIGFSQNKNQEQLGANFAEASWVNIANFSGFFTKADPSKIPDSANPNGQNTLINDGDRISIRNFGSTVLGTSTTTESGIKSLHTFRKRSGENILIKSYGTVLEWYDENEDTWENLNSGYTDGGNFGFADYNINTDLISYTYFGNGTEDFSRWTGAHTNLNGALAGAEATITVDDTTDGFTTTGSLRVCGTTVTYTGKTGTTFTGASGTPACSDNRGITQTVETFPSNPKGNLYMVANNRLFIAGVTSTPQAIYFSKYGDAETYLTSLVSASTAEDAGIFNLGEGGGAVTAMVQDEQALYFFKKALIYRAVLSDSLYSLVSLKPFDGRSQTIGAQTKRSVFVGGNGIFFITPDSQISKLSRVESLDYPQINHISDSISETVTDLNFDDVTGISWRDFALFSVKTSDDSANNDIVLLYNQQLNTWESPIVGWQPSEFAVYDDGNGEKLYFGDATTANVYKVTAGATDNGLGVTANWRSKQFSFGLPYELKEIVDIYIEGYISSNTTLDITLFLDEDGFTQSYTTQFSGTEDDYIFDATLDNTFGLHPFGFLRFGSVDATDKSKFRLYLNKDFAPRNFYNAQIEFLSDGIGDDWEITDFAMRVRPASEKQRRSLFRSFK